MIKLESYIRKGEDYEITLTPVNEIYTPSMNKETVCYPANYVLNVKQDGEELKLPITLMDIPHLLHDGYKINGIYYIGSNILRRAPGWFLVNKNRSEHPVMEYCPHRGNKIEFTYDGMLSVKFKGNKDTSKIPVAVFLKAISGMSYIELVSKLGIRNSVIRNSFIDEPSVEDCVKMCLTSLYGKLNSFPNYYLKQELLARVFGHSRGEDELGRFKITSSFANRLSKAKAKLFQSIVVDGVTYEKDTLLERDLLKKIDESGITNLIVRVGSAAYELVKYDLEGDSLSINSILTAVNTLAVSIGVTTPPDDPYEPVNKRVFNSDNFIIDIVSKNADRVINEVVRTLLLASDSDSSTDKAIRRINVPRDIDKNLVIDKIKQSDGDQLAYGVDNTNSVSTFTQFSKCMSDITGTVTADMTKVKATEIGKFDTYHAPESIKAGLTGFLTLGCNILPNGALVTPYVEFDNCTVLNNGKPKYMDSIETGDLYIASWEQQVLPGNICMCRYGDKFVRVPAEKVNCKEYSPFNNLSLATCTLSFLGNSTGKRLVMGDGQTKQSVETLLSEPPLVSSGTIGLFGVGIIRCEDLVKDYILSNSDGIDNDTLNDMARNAILSLKSMSPLGDYKTFRFELDLNGDVYSLSKSVPFRLKSSTGTIVKTLVNKHTGYVFSGRDIVFHNSDIDISPYDIDYRVDVGEMEIPHLEDLGIEQRLGYNYRVAIVPYGSTTMDDSLTISDKLVCKGMLTNFFITELTHTLVKNKDEEEELVSFSTDSAGGLPSIGTYLTPRSRYLSKRTTYKKTNAVKDTSLTLDATTEGLVISASVESNVAKLVLFRECYPEVGDKMAGCHGNKGVIARIVPEKDMPFDEDGKSVDICINPQGLPSRMNISQLLEAILGYCMKKKGDNCRIVITPQHPLGLDIVNEYKMKYNVEPVQLRDGVTGLPFDRKTTIGYLFLRKLTHSVRSKFNATGNSMSTNPATRQHAKGKKVEGGQTIGEMEISTLIGANCIKTAHFFTSIQSSDIKNALHFQSYLEDLGVAYGEETLIPNNAMLSDLATRVKPPVGANNNDSTARCFLISMGMYMDNNGELNSMRLLTDEDIVKLNNVPMAPDKSNLTSEHEFGQLNGKGLLKNLDRWRYIKSNCEYIHPLIIYKTQIPKLLIVNRNGDHNKFITLNSNMLKNIIKGSLFVSTNRDIPEVSEDDYSGNTWVTGMAGIVVLFNKCNPLHAVTYYTDKINGMQVDNEKRLEEFTRLIDMAKSYAEKGFSGLVLRHFPIMPLYLRAEQGNSVSDFNFYYKEILASAKLGNAERFYNSVLAFTGLDDNAVYKSKDSNAKNLTEYFNGKNSKNHGFLRTKVMSNVISNSGRSVIVSADTNELNVNEIGLPFSGLVSCMRLPILKILEFFHELDNIDHGEFLDSLSVGDLTGMSRLLGKSSEVTTEIYIKIKASVVKFLEQFHCLAGRQPTLHRYGIRCFKIKVTDGLAIKLHPLVCTGYNADFDGDQMWYTVLVTPEITSECINNLSPLCDIVNPKDRDYIINPTQDILLGMYLSTMLKNNVTDIRQSSEYDLSNLRVYDNLEIMEQDIYCGLANTYTPAIYTHVNGNRYYSTMGRILLNSLIEGGFTDKPFTNHLGFMCNPDNYKELLFDGLVKKNVSTHPVLDNGSQFREIRQSNINDYLFKAVGESGMVLVFNRMATIYTSACCKTGITLALEDFVQHPEADALIERAEAEVAKIEKFYAMGYITDEARKLANAARYNYVAKKVKSELLSYYERNNNLFIILDSGARGNLNQINQTCGVIGMVSKSTKEMMETPVLGNYIKGLSPNEGLIITYGTRTGIFKVQSETAKSGELTRILTYLLSNFRIVEDDCGSDCETMEIKYSGSDVKISNNILGRKLSRNWNDFYIFEEMLIDGDTTVTEEVYDAIIRHRLKEVHLEDGVETIKYKLSEFSKSDLLNRESEDLPGLYKGKFITEETLKYIEDNNLESIKVRTLFTCKSVGGVCSHCYGLDDSKKKLLPIGSIIGITAAQAVGEPGTQLTMNAINSGGNTEAANVDILSILKSLIKSANLNQMLALVASEDGHASVRDAGNTYSVYSNGYHTRQKEETIVKDGEWVKSGFQLTTGVINPNSITLDTIPETVYARCLSMADTLHGFFESSNLDVGARNFEVIARAKCSVVRVLQSESDDFTPNRLYFYNQLGDVPEGTRFTYGSHSMRDIVLMYSGFETLATFSDVVSELGRVATDPCLNISVPTSRFGSIFNGHSFEGKPKKLKINVVRDFVDLEIEGEVEDSKTRDLMPVDKIQEVVSDDVFDLLEDDIFGDLGDLLDEEEVVEETTTASVAVEIETDDEAMVEVDF